ncbi:hypothetical protein [Streptomyces sp. CB02923]|uniref:hypothetical protein n=1 Tax=Streptomyces sp. CB02923 TaxID=1718985 RepID=UPI001A90B053|nr:hypothetical protein [Streptomyces sp. CB02923]
MRCSPSATVSTVAAFGLCAVSTRPGNVSSQSYHHTRERSRRRRTMTARTVCPYGSVTSTWGPSPQVAVASSYSCTPRP